MSARIDFDEKQSNDMPSNNLARITTALILCFFSGCTTTNVFEQRSASAINQGCTNCSPHRVARIERGKPRPIVDGLGKVWGIPNRIALGNELVDNHAVSPATEQKVLNYLQDQQLNSVLIRSKQYDPIGEFKRMRANKNIRPVWKATAGGYNLLKYTLLPGRIVGGDWYNPYSQTLNLYSDVAPLAISQAAHAQDIQTRVNPGAYAALKEIPGVGLKHETTATMLAIDWYGQNAPDQVEAAKDVLYPNYGASWGGQLGSFVPYGEVVGRVAGGLIGRAANAVRK